MEGAGWRMLACLLVAAVLSGCGLWEKDAAEEFDDDLPTLDAAVTSTTAPPAGVKEIEPAEAAKPAQPPAIAAGTRVALHRRIVQTLSQGERTDETTLELDFTISIDEIVEDGGRRYGVHYDRVRYRGNIGGETFEFDSQDSEAEPHELALPFQGLADNGFHFWIDQGGKIRLVGFDRFLRHCVDGLPLADREAILSRLLDISDAEGISRFVDETIGLLEARRSGQEQPEELRSGLVWESSRRIADYVPMVIKTDYNVKSLTEDEVHIDIHGVVAPSDTSVVPAGFPVVTVKGGKTLGSCTLDRHTGLPRKSQIEQLIDMSVQLSDTDRFSQSKRVVSTTTRVEKD